MNLTLASAVLKALADEGIKEIVLCSGARNSPLVAALECTEDFTFYRFFEERSAAFFALGRIKNHGRPVAVMTTSGTAAAELFPAVIEGYYGGLPLVLVTADRPRELRGTGAPQCINQVKLFGEHAQPFIDIAAGEMFSLDEWNKKQPLHINVCFTEPLLDEPLTAKTYEIKNFVSHQVCSSQTLALQRKSILNFLKNKKSLVAIVGPLDADQNAISEFLRGLKIPIYAEALSGLRERKDLDSQLIKSGELLLSTKFFDGVLRFGGVPTTRFWRDLESNAGQVPVLSISNVPFPGLTKGEHIHSDVTLLLKDFRPIVAIDDSKLKVLKDLDDKNATALAGFMDQFPLSEPALIHRLSLLIEESSHVYIGNSLPIREWDLSAQRNSDRQWKMAGNRGANGIDGQLSSFFGFCSASDDNWCVVGDLTAMYDLASPWALKQLKARNVRVVVINNSGGQIFSRMFKSKLFLNEHDLRFNEWATMWGLNYESWERVPPAISLEGPTVIELIPDANETEMFWKKYEELWQSSSQGKVI